MGAIILGLLGFAGVFMVSLCFKPTRRLFVSVLTLVLGTGCLLYLVIFAGPHLQATFGFISFIVFGGLLAVFYFVSKRPSS